MFGIYFNTKPDKTESKTMKFENVSDFVQKHLKELILELAKIHRLEM